MKNELMALLLGGIICAMTMPAQAAFTAKTLHLEIKGMTCAGCASGAADAVKQLKGITKADINFDQKTGVFAYDSSKVTEKQIVQAIEKVGYLVSVFSADTDSSSGNEAREKKQMEFQVLGLSCENCANSAKELLSKVPGVREALVTFDTKKGKVKTDGRVTRKQVRQAVAKYGFELRFADEGGLDETPLSKEVLARLDIKTITHGKAFRLKDHLPPGKITIIDYYADWCGPCKLLTPKLERLVWRYEDVALRKVDIVDWKSKAARQATREFKLAGLPFTRIFDESGKLLGQVSGNSIQQIEAIIRQHVSLPESETR